MKAKPNQYRTVEALKNNLTPREGRARLLASAKTSVAQDPVEDSLHPGWLDWARCFGTKPRTAGFRAAHSLRRVCGSDKGTGDVASSKHFGAEGERPEA